MSTLPFVIVEDILCRLPVKSLKRCRCVAKSWCFLIDSEYFIKLHLRRSKITNSHRNLILGGLGLYSVHLDSLDKAQVIRPPFYYKSVDSITNSCNGLVVVMSEPPVLWNPFSRNYKILPESAVELSTELESYSKTAYGFGYDSTNDDYKVVKVVEFRNTISHVWICSETKIYSTKSNSWKRIEGFPYSLPFLKGHWRVHVHGALYTLVEDPDHIHSDEFLKIMAFSVETEKHFEAPMPPRIRLRNVGVNLDVIEECLSVVCSSVSQVIIWVMKEYGVKESWTTLLSIKSPLIDPHDFMKPLVYSRDREKILLNCDDKRLALYDLRNKTFENVVVDGLPFVFYAEVCVESLVSFDPRDEVKKNGAQKKTAKRSSSSKSSPLFSVMISCPKDSSWCSKKELIKWIVQNRMVDDIRKAHSNLLSNTEILVIPTHANVRRLLGEMGIVISSGVFGETGKSGGFATKISAQDSQNIVETNEGRVYIV